MTAPKAAFDTNKHDAILDAALGLFAERGFHGTAVPLVAEKAGVGAGTLYRYFESKEALVNALYQREKTRFGMEIMLSLDLSAPIRRQFHDMWHRMAKFVADHPTSVAFLELHHHGAYMDAASKAVEARVTEPIRAFIVEAQKKQILKAIDPDVLMAIVYGAFVGLQRSSWEKRLDLTPQALEVAENCVWEAIRV
jgi:AcrR family transcriptional regulator